MSPRVRAALIALALFVGLVDGLPLPSPAKAATLPALLERALAGVSAAQAVILSPFRPFKEALLLTERWALFSGASQDRFRLELAGRADLHHPFELLYRADDERHRFLAELLEYRRVRGAWNPRTGEPPPGYDAFADFIARRVFAERSDLDEIRIRMERIHIFDHGGYATSGEFAHELVRVRAPRHGRHARARP